MSKTRRIGKNDNPPEPPGDPPSEPSPPPEPPGEPPIPKNNGRTIQSWKEFATNYTFPPERFESLKKDIGKSVSFKKI